MPEESTDLMPPPPPLAELMTRLGKGRLLTDGGEALKELVDAVRNTRTKGALTIKVTASMAPNSETLIEFGYSIDAKVPKRKGIATYLYANDDGSLSTQDPNQRELAFEGGRGVRG